MSIFNKILVKAGLRVEVTLVDKPFPKVEMDDINALNAHLNAVLTKAAEPNVKFSEVVKVMTAEAPVVELAKEVQVVDARFPASEAVEPAAQAAAEEPAEIKTVKAHIRSVTGGESYGPVKAGDQFPDKNVISEEQAKDIGLGIEALIGKDSDKITATQPETTFVEQLRENSIERSEQPEETQDDYQNLPDFWAVFARRLSARGVLMVNSDKDLLDKKPKLQKGYHLVRLTNTNEAGIVHVSKAALAALFPMASGEYRVVASKRTVHLNGANTVGADVAKLFLNGRY